MINNELDAVRYTLSQFLQAQEFYAKHALAPVTMDEAQFRRNKNGIAYFSRRIAELEAPGTACGGIVESH